MIADNIKTLAKHHGGLSARMRTNVLFVDRALAAGGPGGRQTRADIYDVLRPKLD